MGGDRQAATCRCSTLLDARRAADAVADAGAVRPARGARRARALRRRSSRRSRRETHRRTPPGCARGGHDAARRASSSARRPTTRARRERLRRGAAGDLLGALAPHAQLDLVGHPRRAAAARHRRRRRALQVQTGVASHRAPLRRAGAAASGCPSAPTRRGLTPLLEDAGVRATCVELTDAASASGDPRHLRPLATDDGPRAVADRPRDDRAGVERRRLSRRRRLPRLPPPHRSTTTTPGATTAAPTTTTRALAQARAHAADFVARASRAARVRRRGGGAACARSTPSCSATGGTRASTGSAPSSRSARARGSS